MWRSGLGVTANGAIVYVGGPAMEITDVADLLIRAGAVRGMELDINTDWVNFASYAPTPPDGGAATPQNGTNLISSMTGGTDRYFQSYWSRDFVTMSARSPSAIKSGSNQAGTITPSTTSTTTPRSTRSARGP